MQSTLILYYILLQSIMQKKQVFECWIFLWNKIWSYSKLSTLKPGNHLGSIWTKLPGRLILIFYHPSILILLYLMIWFKLLHLKLICRTDLKQKINILFAAIFIFVVRNSTNMWLCQGDWQGMIQKHLFNPLVLYFASFWNMSIKEWIIWNLLDLMDTKYQNIRVSVKMRHSF